MFRLMLRYGLRVENFSVDKKFNSFNKICKRYRKRLHHPLISCQSAADHVDPESAYDDILNYSNSLNKKMAPATIKDLAKELNLSASTVSRALRDHPDISPLTKKRVISLANKLDYHPDSIAQSLQTQKTKTIGVIVPEIKQPFFASVI